MAASGLPSSGTGIVLRLVLLSVLTIYSAALILASWPFGHRLGGLEPLHTASRELFEALKIRAGTEVFSGNRGAWKRKSLCTTVVGTFEDGSTRRLYETYSNCVVPDVRIFEDTFNVLLMRSGYWREMKPFLGASPKTTRKELRRLQQSGSMQRAARYFCRSPLASVQRPVQVDMLWDVKQEHYGSGKVRTDLLYAQSYDCRRERRQSSTYHRYEVVREPDGGLALQRVSKSHGEEERR